MLYGLHVYVHVLGFVTITSYSGLRSNETMVTDLYKSFTSKSLATI